MTESELTSMIIININTMGIARVWRQNSGRRGHVKFGLAGCADITGIGKNGRRIEIEVKLPGKKPRRDQLEFLAGMLDRGAIAGWVTDIDAAIKLVQRG